MNKKTTPFLPSSSLKSRSSIRSGVGGHPQPSEKTLVFLRGFARNYRVEPQLPQGLQGIILG